MPELMGTLTLDAIAVAVDDRPVYRPATTLTDSTEDAAELADMMARLWHIPIERLAVLDARDARADLPARALAELGPPATEQPLYLVQPQPDPAVIIMPLARVVHGLGWPVCEDLGVTHLHELGGTAVLDLLHWSADPLVGATAVIVDRPVFVDSDDRPATVSAVALRTAVDGPIRVLGSGEGTPPDVDAAHRFTGTGPCDGWLALGDALAAGRVAAGDTVLLHTRTAARQGWALLEIRDPAGVRLAGRARRTPATTGPGGGCAR